MRNKPVQPCKRNCSDRSSDCHAHCCIYQNFRKEMDLFCAEQMLEKEKIGVSRDGIRRVQKTRCTNGIHIGSRRM